MLGWTCSWNDGNYYSLRGEMQATERQKGKLEKGVPEVGTARA